ncbi:hypothetical protein CTJ01_13190, partial [Staphylococcus epidermidis]
SSQAAWWFAYSYAPLCATGLVGSQARQTAGNRSRGGGLERETGAALRRVVEYQLRLLRHPDRLCAAKR